MADPRPARAVFAIPGDLATPTGGYAYARHVLPLLAAYGVEATPLRLPDGFPNPSPEDLAQTERLLAGAPGDAVLLIDGLAYGALPPALVRRLHRRIVALVHHPLGLETGLTEERQAELLENERAVLALARWTIVTSSATAHLLVEDFDVSSNHITIAEPGTAPSRRARGTGSPLSLLAIGAVSPRKGYDVLIGALEGLAETDWRLTIAGALDRAPGTVAALRAQIASAGLETRVTLAGAVDDTRLEALFTFADVFVSASLYEGYGMGLAEALARGLPIVTSTGGAADDTVPDAAAIKVAPGNIEALREALARIIADAALRRRLGEASWSAGQALPRWTHTARLIAGVIRDVAA